MHILVNNFHTTLLSTNQRALQFLWLRACVCAGVRVMQGRRERQYRQRERYKTILPFSECKIYIFNFFTVLDLIYDIFSTETTL